MDTLKHLVLCTLAFVLAGCASHPPVAGTPAEREQIAVLALLCADVLDLRRRQQENPAVEPVPPKWSHFRPKEEGGTWEIVGYLTASDELAFMGHLDAYRPRRVLYGVLAREVANPDRHVVAIRGTRSTAEWLKDGETILDPTVWGHGVFAHHGFYGIYGSMRYEPRSAQTGDKDGKDSKDAKDVKDVKDAKDVKDVKDAKAEDGNDEGKDSENGQEGKEVREIKASQGSTESNEANKPAWRAILDAVQDKPLTVAGHSIGAPLAIFMTMDMASRRDDIAGRYFGAPRPGNAELAKEIDRRIADYVVYDNVRDVVPRMPPTAFGAFFQSAGRIETLQPYNDMLQLGNDMLCQHYAISYAALLQPALMTLDQWQERLAQSRQPRKCIAARGT